MLAPPAAALRSVDLGDHPQMPTPDQAPTPDFAWIPISMLSIDDSYQRPLSKHSWSRITRIAERFDWAHFVPCIVAPSGTRFVIIDGQHRAHAALMRGFDRVPCFVSSIPIAEQARAFSSINGRITAVTRFHLFKAALAAAEPWAVDCARAVADGGCELMTYQPSGSARTARKVWSIALIRDHVAAGRAALVTRVLGAIVESPRAEDPALMQEVFLRPLMSAVAAARACPPLSKFIADLDLSTLERGITALRETPKYRKMSRLKIARAILIDMLERAA
jgi:hypothetical protein